MSQNYRWVKKTANFMGASITLPHVAAANCTSAASFSRHASNVSVTAGGQLSVKKSGKRGSKKQKMVVAGRSSCGRH